MDIGIVNAGKLPIYSEIDENVRNLITEVILNTSENGIAVDRLIEYA
jgi:cobalamin-dependent methionine synthase I